MWILLIGEAKMEPGSISVTVRIVSTALKIKQNQTYKYYLIHCYNSLSVSVSNFDTNRDGRIKLNMIYTMIVAIQVNMLPVYLTFSSQPGRCQAASLVSFLNCRSLYAQRWWHWLSIPMCEKKPQTGSLFACRYFSPLAQWLPHSIIDPDCKAHKVATLDC